MSILKTLPERLLLGPGPSNAHPAVLDAMSRPLIGHLDPEFIALLDRVKEGLRTVFGTGNAMTLPISATGSAGMEAAVVNLLEPGERVVVGRQAKKYGRRKAKRGTPFCKVWHGAPELLVASGSSQHGSRLSHQSRSAVG